MTFKPYKTGACRAFTLAELMVSVAIGLLLIVGVNQVFKTVSDTVGTGYALNEAVRNHRAIRSTLHNDMIGYDTAAVPPTGIYPADDGTGGGLPFLMIRAERTAAFMDQVDAASDLDYDPNTAAESQQSAILSVDLTSSGTETATLAERFNQRNHRTDKLAFFARGAFKRQTGNVDFISSMTADEAFIWYGHLWLPTNNDPMVNSSWYYDGNPSGTSLTFPGHGSARNNPNNFFANQWILGRVALLMRPVDVSNRILDENNIPQWYYGRASGAPATDLAPLAVNSQATRDGTGFLNNLQWSRYDLVGRTITQYRQIVSDAVAADATGWWNGHIDRYRFRGNPFVSRPLTPESAAQAVPIFAQGCAQFIVEFAGDYDGTAGIDTWTVGGITGIRWYGMPRDVDGDGTVGNDIRDVNTVTQPPATPLVFEKEMPAATSRYTCIWSPADLAATPSLRPLLIRITVQLVDANRRLAEGVTQEYIFSTR